MMIQISKEDGDRILENFLISASKENGSVECAKESIEIMNEFDDSNLIVHTLISNSIRNNGKISDDIIAIPPKKENRLLEDYFTEGIVYKSDLDFYNAMIDCKILRKKYQQKV